MIRLLIKKVSLALAIAAMAVCAVSQPVFATDDTAELAVGQNSSAAMRGLTAFQIVNDMGAGWNLGNSLESENNETYWGNPATTKDMIDAVAAKGFTTLRVPVRWDDHYSDASTYTIDTSFMDRVETVVNYGLQNDMYVILNVHHNDLQHNVPDTEAISAELKAVWTQVGEHFKAYGDKLIFEVNNEPRSGDDWTGNSTYYTSVNECNEAARAAIRATGGNNASRLIMLPTYCASGDYAKAVAWTKNADDDMIAVSIHAYLPYDFAFEGSGHTDWLSQDYIELASFFQRMESIFLCKDVPVVIGEFGACNKSNTTYREQYADIYISLARSFAQQDIPCIWWDNNAFSVGAENFGIFDRNNKTFVYSGIAEALVSAYKDDPSFETASTGEELLSSGGSCDTWGQAVSFDASVIAALSEGDVIYCDYTSDNDPEFILQSEINSDKSWVKINPDICSDGTAQWSYETLYNAFDGTFADLTRAFIGATYSSLTVSKVYIPTVAAHTHLYNGTETVTIPATETTNGRKTIACSVQGCESVKIVVTDCVTASIIPQNVKAAGSNKAATITWDAVENATNYAVLMRKGSSWVTLGSTGTSTTYTAENLVNGGKYFFSVRAYVNGAWSDYSTVATAFPTAGIIPQNVKAIGGDTKATITWDAVEGATNYSVLVRKGTEWVTLGASGSNTVYTARNLVNGGKYFFVVKAYVNGKWSAASDVVTAFSVGIIPQNVKAEGGDTIATVTWDAVSGATNYAVLMRKGTSWVTLGATGVDTSYTATGLVNGGKYFFVVKAYANGAWSDASVIVTAFPTV